MQCRQRSSTYIVQSMSEWRNKHIYSTAYYRGVYLRSISLLTGHGNTGVHTVSLIVCSYASHFDNVAT